MKKIYFYLILLCSINFYANDTIKTISLKNSNLREQCTTDSKILAEIKTGDTLKITSLNDNWCKAIYKDSLNGYVKNESLEVIKNDLDEIIQLKIMQRLLFKTFIILSILCFIILNSLKKKLIQLEINGKISLIAKSLLIGFVLTIIGTLYFFYDQLSFFKIIGIGILLIVLYYRISSVFKIEKKIKDDKLIINNNSKENLKDISKEILREQIINENNKLAETKSNLDNAINKTNEIKSEQLKLIEEKLIELYGVENTNELINNEKPFVGLHKIFLDYFIGNPEKINESSDTDNKWETYFYDKINNRGHDGTFRLKINIQNDLVTSFQLR